MPGRDIDEFIRIYQKVMAEREEHVAHLTQQIETRIRLLSALGVMYINPIEWERQGR